MILTALSQTEISERLHKMHLGGERALRTYAGFADSSGYAGQARQTFSLLLSEADVSYLQKTMLQLYQQLLADLTEQPPEGTIAFDFIRIDAYYDVTKKQLQVLEINSRDAGMHEICQWLDSKVLQVIPGSSPYELNDAIAINQKAWHEAHLGPVERLLYMSREDIPRWLYYESLDAHYPQVADVSSWRDVTVTPGGVAYLGDVYQAIVTKAANSMPAAVRELVERGVVSRVQTRCNSFMGDKKYLESLNLNFIAVSKPLSQTDHETYIKNQVDLVLKKGKSSGSRGVVVGRGLSNEAWQQALQTAYGEPTAWTLQSYAEPGNGNCVPHGIAPQDCRVQLGIFVLPNPADPSQIDIDIVVKGYVGADEAVLFDPASHKADIWFGNVIVCTGQTELTADR